jgi:cell division protein FtsQ
MWDNPRLLNAAAGFLVGIATLAASAAALYWLLHSPLFPVRTVELASPLQRVPQAALEATLAHFRSGNFFAAPIGELAAELERLPWVRRAAVRRVWPDRLQVRIEEHVALARWGNQGLVDTEGERFSAESDAKLPIFVGPPGSEAELARRYASFSRIVAPLGSRIERITLSERRAWQLALASGLELVLGRDADVAEARLARFVGACDSLPSGAPGGGALVDLRYANGFTLRVKG